MDRQERAASQLARVREAQLRRVAGDGETQLTEEQLQMFNALHDATPASDILLELSGRVQTAVWATAETEADSKATADEQRLVYLLEVCAEEAARLGL